MFEQSTAFTISPSKAPKIVRWGVEHHNSPSAKSTAKTSFVDHCPSSSSQNPHSVVAKEDEDGTRTSSRSAKSLLCSTRLASSAPSWKIRTPTGAAASFLPSSLAEPLRRRSEGPLKAVSKTTAPLPNWFSTAAGTATAAAEPSAAATVALPPAATAAPRDNRSATTTPPSNTLVNFAPLPAIRVPRSSFSAAAAAAATAVTLKVRDVG